MNNNKECIILSRVSTVKQDFTPQIEDLKKYAAQYNYTNFHIISTKESGFRSFQNKEGFKQVVEYINSHSNCRTIFITELSRLSRYRSVIFAIQDYLIKNKIQLYVKDNNLQLFDNNGNINESNQLMFSIFASLSESEMRQKKERFSRAKSSLFADGYSITGKQLFGYKRVYDENKKRNTYIINEEQAQQIKTVYDWYIHGINGQQTSIQKISLECIANDFDRYLHSKRNVNKMLKEQAYTGHKITNNRKKNAEYWDYDNKDAAKYVPATSMSIKYPQIISVDLYNKVQEKMSIYSTHLQKNVSNNINVDKSTKHITILSQLIVCDKCNHFYTAEYKLVNNYHSHYYRCAHVKLKKYDTNNENGVSRCDNKKLVSLIMLDSIIWSYIRANIKTLITEMQERNRQINVENIKNEITNLREKITEIEKDKLAENNIYRMNFKLKNANIEEITNIYDINLNKLDDEINRMNKLINEKEKLISEVENTSNINIDEIESQISEIEKDKALIKKYVQMLVKKIKILSTTKTFIDIAVYKINNIDKDNDYLFDILHVKKTTSKNLTLTLVSSNIANSITNNEHSIYLKNKIDLLLDNNKHRIDKEYEQSIINKEIEYHRFDDSLYINDIPHK